MMPIHGLIFRKDTRQMGRQDRQRGQRNAQPDARRADSNRAEGSRFKGQVNFFAAVIIDVLCSQGGAAQPCGV